MHEQDVITYRYKRRIYPNKTQLEIILRTVQACRYVYNGCLAFCIQNHKDNAVSELVSLGLCTAAKIGEMLPEDIKGQKYIKAATHIEKRHLRQAYLTAFAKRKKDKAVGKPLTPFKYMPRFKRATTDKPSFEIQVQNSNSSASKGTIVMDWDHRRIKFPVLGYLKTRIGDHKTAKPTARQDKRFDGEIVGASILDEGGGKWYISLVVKTKKPDPLPKTGKEVGIDAGLTNHYIFDDGTILENPRIAKKLEKRKKRLQRELARRQGRSGKGEDFREASKRWYKTKKKLDILCAKERHIRSNLAHQRSYRIVKDYDLICVESLDIQNMMKNHHLAASISDAAWGMCYNHLEYKANRYGKTFVKAPKGFASSQICSVCGHKNTKMGGIKNLGKRKLRCEKCHAVLDRDINAATNVKRKAKQKLEAVG